jgi:CHAT domain-containing protein/Tfp pilus assembly protein PilF
VGLAYSNAGQSEKAIGYYEQALEIEREIKDRGAEGRTLNNLGVAYAFGLGQREKAIGYYEQALVIRRELGDRLGEGRMLGNLGIAYFALSQSEKAIGYYEQALAIFRGEKYRQGEVQALVNLGNAYDALSQYEKAIGYYEHALATAREIKDRLREGWALGNLGIAYRNLSQYEKAIGYHEQSLAISREIKDRNGEGSALGNLGVAYEKLSQYEKAIGYYEQVLAIFREIKDRGGEGTALGKLGIAYEKLGQYEKAIGYYEQALAIFHEEMYRRGEGETLNNLGNAYKDLSQYGKATGYYAQALAISREVKDRRVEADELSGLMDTWQASGRPRLAIFYGKQAVNTVQSMRSDIAGLGQDLQQGFLKGNEKPYHRLAEILIAQGRLAEAEEVLALLKEEEFFQYIRRDAGEVSSLNRRADLTPDEADYEKRYREIGDQLMTIGKERGDLLGKKTLTAEQSQRLAKLEQDLAAGNYAFERFLGDLTQHFSAKPEMTGRVETLRETQGIMEDLRELPPGTVAIYTLIGDDKFHAILRTPDAQKAYEYPIKAADLNGKIFEFRAMLQDPKRDPRPLAQELYKILIAGMADDLRQAKAQTLMWSLDGALRYVPLAALYDGQQYLIERYRVSVMTLASDTRLKDRPARKWKAAGFGVTKGYEDASALPSVSAELTGIIKALGGEIKLDDQFTQQSMRQTLLKRYPVVHIASHFRFQPGNDTKSFLLLGDGGHLTLAELKTSANLFGGVQLLTLSACNTGVGDGAEVEGFGTLAQRQGAKSVIASLWSVADESTSRLMQEFYRIRESSPGMTKLEALRESQLRLLRGDAKPGGAEGEHGVQVAGEAKGARDYRHPYYWAPFFLMGNWL